MTTPIRNDAPGRVHHIAVRGVERLPIFRDDADRTTFVRIARHYLRRTGTRCLAWALMPNHAHLALVSGPVHISVVMHRINTTYVKYFNLRHERVGHLFQGRFASWVVNDGAHLWRLLRYVPLNPLTGGVVATVDELERYPWTSLREVLLQSADALVDLALVASYFGGQTPVAIRSYRAHVVAGALELPPADSSPLGIPSGENKPQSETRHHRPLPRRAAPAAPERHREPQFPRPDRRERIHQMARCAGWSIAGVVAWSCRRVGVNPDAVRRGRRERRASEGRAVAALVAYEVLGVSKSAIAREVGVSLPAVARCIERGVPTLERVDRCGFVSRLVLECRAERRDVPAPACGAS